MNNAWEVNASTAHLDGHNLCSKSHNSPNDAFLGRNSSLSLDTRGKIEEAKRQHHFERLLEGE